MRCCRCAAFSLNNSLSKRGCFYSFRGLFASSTAHYMHGSRIDEAGDVRASRLGVEARSEPLPSPSQKGEFKGVKKDKTTKSVTLEQVKALLASSLSSDAQRDHCTTNTATHFVEGPRSRPRKPRDRRRTVRSFQHSESFEWRSRHSAFVYILGNAMTPKGCQCVIIPMGDTCQEKKQRCASSQSGRKHHQMKWMGANVFNRLPAFLRNHLSHHGNTSQFLLLVLPGMLPGLLVRIPQSYLPFVKHQCRLPRPSVVQVIRRVKRNVQSADYDPDSHGNQGSSTSKRKNMKWKGLPGRNALPVMVCPYGRTSLCSHCPWMVQLPIYDTKLEKINSDSSGWKSQTLKQDFKAVGEQYQRKKDVEMWRAKAQEHLKASVGEKKKMIEEEIRVFRQHRALSLKAELPEFMLPLIHRPTLHRSQECHMVYISPVYMGNPEDASIAGGNGSQVPSVSPSLSPPRFTLLNPAAVRSCSLEPLESDKWPALFDETRPDGSHRCSRTLFSSSVSVEKKDTPGSNSTPSSAPKKEGQVDEDPLSRDAREKEQWLAKEASLAARENDERLQSLRGGKQLFLSTRAAMAACRSPIAVHCSWCSLEQQRLMKTLSDWAAQLPLSLQHCPLGATVLQIYNRSDHSTPSAGNAPMRESFNAIQGVAESGRNTEDGLDIFQVVVWLREECVNSTEEGCRCGAEDTIREYSPSPLCGPSHPPSSLSTAEQQLVAAVQRAAPLVNKVEVFLSILHTHPNNISSNFQTDQSLHRLQRLTFPLCRRVGLETNVWRDFNSTDFTVPTTQEGVKGEEELNKDQRPFSVWKQEDSTNKGIGIHEFSDEDDDGLSTPKAVARQVGSLVGTAHRSSASSASTSASNRLDQQLSYPTHLSTTATIDTRPVTCVAGFPLSFAIRCVACSSVKTNEEPFERPLRNNQANVQDELHGVQFPPVPLVIRIPRIPAVLYHLFLAKPVLHKQVQTEQVKMNSSATNNTSYSTPSTFSSLSYRVSPVYSLLLARVPFWRHTGALDLVLSMVLTLVLADHDRVPLDSSQIQLSKRGEKEEEKEEVVMPVSAVWCCVSKSFLSSSRLMLEEGLNPSHINGLESGRNGKALESKALYQKASDAGGNDDPSADGIGATALLSETLLHLTSELNACLAKPINKKREEEKNGRGSCPSSSISGKTSCLTSTSTSALLSSHTSKEFLLSSGRSKQTGQQRTFVDKNGVPLILVVVPNLDKKTSVPQPFFRGKRDKEQEEQEEVLDSNIGDFVWSSVVSPLLNGLPETDSERCNTLDCTRKGSNLLCRVLMLQCSTNLSFMPLSEAYFHLLHSNSIISDEKTKKKGRWTQRRCGVVDVDPMTSSAVGFAVMDLIGSDNSDQSS